LFDQGKAPATRFIEKWERPKPLAEGLTDAFGLASGQPAGPWGRNPLEDSTSTAAEKYGSYFFIFPFSLTDFKRAFSRDSLQDRQWTTC